MPVYYLKIYADIIFIFTIIPVWRCHSRSSYFENFLVLSTLEVIIFYPCSTVIRAAFILWYWPKHAGSSSFFSSGRQKSIATSMSWVLGSVLSFLLSNTSNKCTSTSLFVQLCAKEKLVCRLNLDRSATALLFYLGEQRGETLVVGPVFGQVVLRASIIWYREVR
jgi:hypothetical protein